MRFFRIPSFTGIEAHRDDADRGSLRLVEGCLPHGPGGLRSGPVWKKIGDVQYVADGDQNKISSADDGLGNSIVFVSRQNEVHDIALLTTEHTELESLTEQEEFTFEDPSLYTAGPANITPIGNKLYAVGDGSNESIFVGKGPDDTFEVFPDESLYSQEWSRFPKCQFFVQGPKKTIFAAGNPDKPLTVYISEPAGLTSPYRDTPYSTEDTTYNRGVLSTVDILGSNASKITALSTRGDQVVVHTDKGCHLLYAPAPDQANTGYRVEQAPATNFSAAVNSKVVSRASGALTYWVGHDGQVYKDEAASRGSEDLRSRADEDQANWKSKGVWEDELPTDLTKSFALYSPQTGMYWFFVESEEKKTFDLIPRTPLRAPRNLIARILAPFFGPTNLDAIILQPEVGPTNLQALLLPPKSGPTNLAAVILPPEVGPTNLDTEVLLPESGPTNLQAELLRPFKGPTNLNAKVIPPVSGPTNLQALILPPEVGPTNLEAVILPPEVGPTNLQAEVLPPEVGPTNLQAEVLPPEVGPTNLEALLLPPEAGPTNLEAEVLTSGGGGAEASSKFLIVAIHDLGVSQLNAYYGSTGIPSSYEAFKGTSQVNGGYEEPGGSVSVNAFDSLGTLLLTVDSYEEVLLGDHTTNPSGLLDEEGVRYYSTNGNYFNDNIFSISATTHANFDFIGWRVIGDTNSFQTLSSSLDTTLNIKILDASLGTIRVYADYSYVGHWDCGSSSDTCSPNPYNGAYGLESECLDSCTFTDPDPVYRWNLEDCQCVTDAGDGSGDFQTENDCLAHMNQATFNCIDGECVEDDMHMGTYSNCADCQADCGSGGSDTCDDTAGIYDYSSENNICFESMNPSSMQYTECDCVDLGATIIE